MENLVTAVEGKADSSVICPEDSGFWASRLVNSGLQDAQAGDAGARHDWLKAEAWTKGLWESFLAWAFHNLKTVSGCWRIQWLLICCLGISSHPSFLYERRKRRFLLPCELLKKPKKVGGAIYSDPMRGKLMATKNSWKQVNLQSHQGATRQIQYLLPGRYSRASLWPAGLWDGCIAVCGEVCDRAGQGDKSSWSSNPRGFRCGSYLCHYRDKTAEKCGLEEERKEEREQWAILPPS